MDVVDPSPSDRDSPGGNSSRMQNLEAPVTREANPSSDTSAQATPNTRKHRLGRCVSCGFELRRSHFQKGDFLRLLLFQVPARCRRCGDRQHTFAPMAVLTGAPWRPMKRPSTVGDEVQTSSAAGPINLRQRNAPMVPAEVLLEQKKKPRARGRDDGYN